MQTLIINQEDKIKNWNLIPSCLEVWSFFHATLVPAQEVNQLYSDYLNKKLIAICEEFKTSFA